MNNKNLRQKITNLLNILIGSLLIYMGGVVMGGGLFMGLNYFWLLFVGPIIGIFGTRYIVKTKP